MRKSCKECVRVSNVVSIEEYKRSKKLRWFFDSLKYTLYCPRAMLKLFDFRLEPDRYPFGWTIVCRSCQGDHCSVSMVDVADYHATIIVAVLCYDCGSRWRHPDVESLYETILLEWPEVGDEVKRR